MTDTSKTVLPSPEDIQRFMQTLRTFHDSLGSTEQQLMDVLLTAVAQAKADDVQGYATNNGLGPYVNNMIDKIGEAVNSLLQATNIDIHKAFQGVTVYYADA